MRSTVLDFPPQILQLDNQMKTRQDITNEVVAILRQRGFRVWWYAYHHLAIKYYRQWHPTPSETCNWIIK